MSTSILIVSRLPPQMQIERSVNRLLLTIEPIPNRNARERSARGDTDVFESFFSLFLRPVTVVSSSGCFAMTTGRVEAAAMTESVGNRRRCQNDC